MMILILKAAFLSNKQIINPNINTILTHKWTEMRNSYELYKTISMPLIGMLKFPCGSNYSTYTHAIFSEHSQCNTKDPEYVPVLIICRCDKKPLLLSRHIKVIRLESTCFMQLCEYKKTKGKWREGGNKSNAGKV